MAARSTAADPAYWCFVLLGAGTLFPWNAVITAADYWEARYPVSSIPSIPLLSLRASQHFIRRGNAIGHAACPMDQPPCALPLPQGKHTDRLLTVSYLPANLVVIAAMVHYHAHMRPRLRIMGGLLGFTLAVSAVPLVSRTAQYTACTSARTRSLTHRHLALPSLRASVR